MPKIILSRSLLLVFVLTAAAAASAGVQSRVAAREFRQLREGAGPGARLRLERLVVGDTVQTLDLERFEVWAPDAEIVVEDGAGGRRTIPPPPIRYYRGTVEGVQESMVFFASRADGALEGFIIENDRRFEVRSAGGEDVLIEDVTFSEDANGAFQCDLDRNPISTPRGVPRVHTEDLREGITTNGALSGTGSWTLNLAIETDYELYQDFGSNATTVTTFIGNLVGAGSVIYRRDLRTDLVVRFARVQTAVGDPFTINPGSTGMWNGSSTTYSSSHALAELGDLWANAGTRPYNGPRSSVVLLSGKNQTAGVAWIARACQGDFACSGGNCGSALFDGHTGGGYAYVGLGNPSTSVPDPNATNNGIQYGLPSNYWSLLGFTHELGHNVDGPHTHCFALTAANKSTYGVTRNFIDECVNGCFAGATSVPPEKGTIMSYCHLLGSSQSRFLFGKAGEVSELMANRIQSYINSRTPASPAISAPASLGPGASANASISAPVGGITYDWTITNGVINGAVSGTTINFTATTNPVTLRVRGTNSSGCAASDFVNVGVTSCTAPVFTSLPASTTIVEGVTVELLAGASGTGPISYQWYVGSSGNTATPAASGNPINATPSTTTSYWVRAMGACGSVDSPTITLTVEPAPEPTATGLYFVTPCRLLDTREAAGQYGAPALGADSERIFQVTGRCGIPGGAKSVVANLTAVSPSATGQLTVYPAGSPWPGTSSLGYRAGKTRAANSLLTLSVSGRVTVRNVGAAQHIIIDVTGYFN